MSMRRKELAQLPDGSDGRSFLYVAERSDGALKIGCTRSLRARMGSHFDTWRALGYRFEGMYAVAANGGNRFHRERKLVSDLAKFPGSFFEGRELFFGVPLKYAMDCVADRAEAA